MTTPDDLVERVARAMAKMRWSDDELWGLLKDEARAAIREMIPSGSGQPLDPDDRAHRDR